MLAEFFPDTILITCEGGPHECLYPKNLGGDSAGPDFEREKAGLVAALAAAKRAPGRYATELSRYTLNIDMGLPALCEYEDVETVHSYGDSNSFGAVNGFGILTRADGNYANEQRYQALLAATLAAGMREAA